MKKPLTDADLARIVDVLASRLESEFKLARCLLEPMSFDERGR
jgi:hypothetical protein